MWGAVRLLANWCHDDWVRSKEADNRLSKTAAAFAVACDWVTKAGAFVSFILFLLVATLLFAAGAYALSGLFALLAGTSILIVGAAGGVGSILTQLARRLTSEGHCHGIAPGDGAARATWQGREGR